MNECKHGLGTENTEKNIALNLEKNLFFNAEHQERKQHVPCTWKMSKTTKFLSLCYELAGVRSANPQTQIRCSNH